MKNIFDFPHVKSVRAWALMLKGEMAGKIVANFSDNPNGSVCAAQVIIWTGPLSSKEIRPVALGKAGGYGYDKFSAAVSDSLQKLGLGYDSLKDKVKDQKEIYGMSGAGDSSVKAFFSKNGYTIVEVI